MFPTQFDIKQRQAEGIIVISKLKPDLILYVETVYRVFSFKISSGETIGLANGHEPFITDINCRLIGCIDEHGKLYSDNIVYGLHLIIATPKGRVVTGRVLGVTVQGADWSYDLWL
jgi:F0F1-type ATP synthase epsilon subunit